MNYPIVEERAGHWFHQCLTGRFYFKNHTDFLSDKRTYVPYCMRCEDWIYPDEAACFDKATSRNGYPLIHQKCRDTQ